MQKDCETWLTNKEHLNKEGLPYGTWMKAGSQGGSGTSSSEQRPPLPRAMATGPPPRVRTRDLKMTVTTYTVAPNAPLEKKKETRNFWDT